MFGLLKKKGTDLLKDVSGVKMEVIEGAAAGAFILAMADGEVEESEIIETIESLKNFPGISEKVSASEIERVVEKMEGHTRRRAMGKIALKRELQEAAARANEEDREMILALVYNVSMADGEMEPEERTAFIDIAKTLGVSTKDYGI